MSVRDGEPVEIDPPAMRQAIAWQFVLRAVHRQEKRAAEEALKQESGADDVCDIQVGAFPWLGLYPDTFIDLYFILGPGEGADKAVCMGQQACILAFSSNGCRNGARCPCFICPQLINPPLPVLLGCLSPVVLSRSMGKCVCLPCACMFP